MPKRGQSNRRTEIGATTYRAGGFSPRGFSASENAAQWDCPRGLKQTARLQSPAFTLIEMLVAVGLLLVMMGLASQVFKIALEGTGRLTQLSEIDRSIRMIEDQLGRELATVDPTRSILAIQGNPSPAYWTEEQKQRDIDDGNVLNGIGNQQYIIDPQRENPTLGYDVLDAESTTGNPAPDGSYDWTTDDDFYPLLPRADILMFIANLSDERSKVDDRIKSDGPVMIVYNHAELGELDASTTNVFISSGAMEQPGGSGDVGGFIWDNDSTNDWLGGAPRRIPQLQPGSPDPVMDPDLDAQDVARFWHLARRAILLKNTFDSKENPPTGQGFDRYAHVLSPSNPADNQHAGLLSSGAVGSIDSATEKHYLNWILGGEMDVVSPISPLGTLVSGQFFAMHSSNDQDFVYEYEIVNRYFGGPVGTTLDPTTWPDATTVRNPGVDYRGAVPAWWLARSHLDPRPPTGLQHRLAHYFLPNCASFKVEWTPNDIRLEQAGLPEVVWIDPFKEPGNPNRAGYTPPASTNAPIDSITLNSVIKPTHLDEFEIMAQKMAPESGVLLANSATLGGPGSGSAFDPSGSLLYQVQNELTWGLDGLGGRFGLSVPGAVRAAQANVFDADPTTVGVEPSYNTHSWYAKDLELLPDGTGGFLPKTSTGADPMWPKALRITIDLFDDAGKLDRPVRHTFIVPIGSKGDRKSS